jgi:hypothetical protein
MIYYDKKITTIKEAINFLKWCRVIHWRYTKHPKWCRGNVGRLNQDRISQNPSLKIGLENYS